MIGRRAIGAIPLGAVGTGSPPRPPLVPLASNTIPVAQRITLVEIEAASTAPVVRVRQPPKPLGGRALASRTLGGGTPPTTPVRPTTTLRASDVGYRSRAADADGVQPYVPVLDEALTVDRIINLTPQASAAGAAWGRVRLINLDARFTALAGTYSPAGRAITVRTAFTRQDTAPIGGLESGAALALESGAYLSWEWP